MRDRILWIRTPKHDNSFRLPPRQLEVASSNALEEGRALGLDPVGGRLGASALSPREPDLYGKVYQISL